MSKGRGQKRRADKQLKYLKKLMLRYGNFFIKFGKDSDGIRRCATYAQELSRDWINYCRRENVEMLDKSDPEKMFISKLREYEEQIKKTIKAGG